MTGIIRKTKTLRAPDAATVGEFIDRVALGVQSDGRRRTPKAVAGRLLEEAMELYLTCGGSTGEALAKVADVAHNECMKVTHQTKKLSFPSWLDLDCGNDTPTIMNEAADIALILKDLVYITQGDLAAAEAEKWNVFTAPGNRYWVSGEGVLYRQKAHITDATGE